MSNQPELEQLMCDFDVSVGEDFAADAVVVSAEEYLRPQDIHRAVAFNMEQSQVFCFDLRGYMFTRTGSTCFSDLNTSVCQPNK